MTEGRRHEIVKECLRQEESSHYTSTSLFIWLRSIRRWRAFFLVAPIVLGGLAGLSILQDQELVPPIVIALLTFVAGLFPAIADALKIQTNVEEIARIAAEFKALQDRFRRTALVTAQYGDVEKADQALAELMDRMDAARSNSITAPERFFKAAQKKIDKGDYKFGVDTAESKGK
jgi:hypothetical protein